MRCIEFQQRMNDLLDQRQSPETDPLLRRHAESCMHCRAVLRLQAMVLGPIGISTTVSPSVNGVESSLGASPRRWRRLAGIVVAAALSVALCAAVVPWGRVGRYNEKVDRTARAAGAGTREAVNVELTRFGGLPSPSPTAGMISWRLSPPIHWGVAASQVEFGWDGLLTSVEPASSDMWLKHVEKGFGPLAHSLSSTINVIRSTWPISRSRHTELLRNRSFDRPSLDTDPARAG